jgi:hypothetical protein
MRSIREASIVPLHPPNLKAVIIEPVTRGNIHAEPMVSRINDINSISQERQKHQKRKRQEISKTVARTPFKGNNSSVILNPGRTALVLLNVY